MRECSPNSSEPREDDPCEAGPSGVQFIVPSHSDEPGPSRVRPIKRPHLTKNSKGRAKRRKGIPKSKSKKKEAFFDKTCKVYTLVDVSIRLNRRIAKEEEKKKVCVKTCLYRSEEIENMILKPKRIRCVFCLKKFHLECLSYPQDLIDRIMKKRFHHWVCPKCAFCEECGKLITDVKNAQCIGCARAFHGDCAVSRGQFMDPRDCYSLFRCDKCKKLSLPQFQVADVHLPSPNNEDNIDKEIYIDDLTYDEINRLRKETNTVYMRNFTKKGKTTVSEYEAFSTKLQDRYRVLNFEALSALIPTIEVGDKKSQISSNDLYDCTISHDYNMLGKENIEKAFTEKSENPNQHCIHFGRSHITISGLIRYPKHLLHSPDIYVCEFCFLALSSKYGMEIHQLFCNWRHPPGVQIYHDSPYSFWLVKAIDDLEKEYCRRLCKFGKLFISSKVEDFFVNEFNFFILTKYVSEGQKFSFIGYFSKEIQVTVNVLSCVLVLPTFQQGGFGTYLVDLSYYLARKEGNIGGPEIPISLSGFRLFTHYWRAAIVSKILEMSSEKRLFKDSQFEKETSIPKIDFLYVLREAKFATDFHMKNNIQLINLLKIYRKPKKFFRRRIVYPVNFIKDF